MSKSKRELAEQARRAEEIVRTYRDGTYVPQPGDKQVLRDEIKRLEEEKRNQTGQSTTEQSSVCGRCGGSGSESYYEYSSGDSVLTSSTCSRCHGSGRE